MTRHKGKPSGVGKNKASQLSTSTSRLHTDRVMDDRYTESPDEAAANVRMRHPNRHLFKEEERLENES